jgi:hypothetical protein
VEDKGSIVAKLAESGWNTGFTPGPQDASMTDAEREVVSGAVEDIRAYLRIRTGMVDLHAMNLQAMMA